MSPDVLELVRAPGPMRLVLSAYPSREAALSAVEGALGRRLVACANLMSGESRFWWKGGIESASETFVLFKTLAKQVGALFRFVRDTHPYDVPEIVEIDVPRVDPGYLAYLFETLEPNAARPPRGPRATRRGGPRGRGGRALPRTRAKRRRPSR